MAYRYSALSYLRPCQTKNSLVDFIISRASIFSLASSPASTRALTRLLTLSNSVTSIFGFVLRPFFLGRFRRRVGFIIAFIPTACCHFSKLLQVPAVLTHFPTTAQNFSRRCKFFASGSPVVIQVCQSRSARRMVALCTAMPTPSKAPPTSPAPLPGNFVGSGSCRLSRLYCRRFLFEEFIPLLPELEEFVPLVLGNNISNRNHTVLH